MSQFDSFTARRMKQLSVENWDAFLRAIDARFGVLEEQLGIEREVTERILQRGLQIIEDQLTPTVSEAQTRANEITQAARELGLLFRASSTSTLAIGEGSRTFVLAEHERNRFAAPLFVIAAAQGDVTKWMAGQVTAWDVVTGTLTVRVDQSRGEGSFAAWDISIAGIPPEAPPAQAIEDIPGLSAALAAKAPVASPSFTGTPSAPTPATTDNSMRLATTAYVRSAINAVIDAAPGALDTLNELAAALGDDPNFATTVLTAIATHDHSGKALIPDTLRIARSFTLASAVDLNSVTTGGFYDCSNAVNKPSGSSGWGYLLVQRHANSANFCTQTWIDLDSSSPNSWTRIRNNGTWTPWRQFVHPATDAQIRAATAGPHAICAEDLETASGIVGLADAATIAVNWDTFINGLVTIAGNRTLGTPTNVQQGTWRTLWVQGNDATARQLSFASGYLGPGAVPFPITNTSRYLIPMFGLGDPWTLVGAPIGPF
jgi:hypothetical protein